MGTTWLLAIASLVVGFGPLVFRRPSPFLAAGGLLATFFWVIGQGIGGIFTGSGTDPNSGPLIVLLALAMVPAAAPGSGVVALPVLDRALSLSGVGAGKPGGAAGRALPQCRLPGGCPGIDQHGDGRHDRHVGGDVGLGRRDGDDCHLHQGNNGAPRTGWTSRTRPTWSWLGLAPR